MRKTHALTAESLFGDVRSGRRYTVLIDDTGSPGDKNTPGNLHPQRKSWVSVVLTPRQSWEVSNQLPQALDYLRSETGASEFHFTDIYSGRKAFEHIALDLRLSLFRFMAFIFTTYKFPIIVQTLDPDNAMYQDMRDTFPNDIGPFKSSKPGDVALLMLLIRTKWFLKEQGVTPATAARVFIDEGFMKHGRAFSLKTFAEVFDQGLLCFANSHSVPHIQLADFAAFSLNRTQWLIGKEKLTPLDREFIGILSPITWNFVNIKPIILPKDWWSDDPQDTN
jgi:hypothetical protein